MNAVIYVTKIPEQYKNKNMDHMVGEKLLELALKREYNKTLHFEPRDKGEHGKPFFTLSPEIHYNISHSGDYVACAFAHQPVGFDIQKHQPVRKELVLKRMVSDEERERILSSEHAEEEFFREWVLRESYIKWTGEGLSRNLKTIPMDSGWHRILPFKEGYSAAIWTADPQEIRWEEVTVELV